jgi:hypothetical protein
MQMSKVPIISGYDLVYQPLKTYINLARGSVNINFFQKQRQRNKLPTLHKIEHCKYYNILVKGYDPRPLLFKEGEINRDAWLVKIEGEINRYP